jgi:hypothetical protein
VLDRLGDQVRREQKGKYHALCPAHNDTNPSLELTVKGEKFVMICRAGCENDDILKAIGLTWPKVFGTDNTVAGNGHSDSKAKHWSTLTDAIRALEYHRGPADGRWMYDNATGEQVGAVLRWDQDDGKKKILPLTKSAKGWRSAHMPTPRPVYRLPELLAADKAERVYVVEGEKCADCAHKLGLIATTSAGGNSAAANSDWSPLAGRQIVILPDADAAGEKYTQDVVRIVTGMTPPAVVQIVRLPGLGDGGDIVDFVEGGGTAEQLRELAANAPTWVGDTKRAETAHPDDDRPVIVIGVDEERVNNEAISALKDEPALYQRANMLVHVLRDSAKTRHILRPPGSPRIVLLPNPRLREMLARRARWLANKTRSNGDSYQAPAHPPNWSVTGIAARGAWDGIRHLEAVVEAPTLYPDGTILDIPGWDPDTGLLYEPRVTFPKVPDRPTLEDAQAVAEVLFDLVLQFPFADNGHVVAWLAALLTVFARFAFYGPAPLFLFTANTPGTGKTLLASIITEINAGREMARTPYVASDQEMNKIITAVALAGDQMVLLDNIDTAISLGCASLDSALTATTWKQRLLGESKMTPELPLFTVWFASGNNVSLRGDIFRRGVPIRLESREERPEQRQGFKYPDLLGYIRANRPALVVAALTILRGYFAAGCPTSNLPAFGSYEGWSAVIRNAVFWVTGLDPTATREDITEADESLSILASVLDGWSRLPGGTGDGVSITDALRAIGGSLTGDHDALRDALMNWSKNDKLPTAKQIAYKFRAANGRVVNGRRLKGTPNRIGVMLWRVEVCR